MTIPPSTPPSIVLVDDSEDLRTAIRVHFERQRLFSVIAEGGTGFDAVTLAAEHTPDVMLLDVSMPGKDGLEALPEVLSASPRTKVIMFTGFAQHGLSERARDLGALALLEKSLSLRALPAEVARLIGGGPTPPVTTAPTPPAAEPTPSIADEQLERFREVFEEAAIGMGTMTLSGQLVRGNKTFLELSRLPSDSLVGYRYERLVAETERDEFQSLLSGAITAHDGGEGLFQLEHRLNDTIGLRWMRTTLAPVRDSHGKALYLFVQMQEITESREIALALRQTEARFESVVEAVEDAIAVLDPAGFIESWNPGAERMTGYAAEEIVGQHIGMLYSAEARRMRYPQQLLRRALAEGHLEEEGSQSRKNGDRFWANDRITAIYDSAGAHAGFAKITRDASIRRQQWVDQQAAGQALDRANADLQAENAGLTQSAEDQAQFVAVTAHELRTPVALIADLADSLRDHDSDPDERRRDLDAMVSSAGRLQRLLDDLLAAARLDAQSMQLSRRRISLGSVVASSVEVVSRRYPQTPIQVLDSDPDAVGDDDVDADPQRLEQIVDNLINNALNHGRPPVTVEVIRRQDTVELRVSDSGVGVPTDFHDRLFDRYVTAARSGTGLGLYIVRELARAHGGDSWYEGANPVPTFVVSLPRRENLAVAPSRTD